MEVGDLDPRTLNKIDVTPETMRAVFSLVSILREMAGEERMILSRDILEELGYVGVGTALIAACRLLALTTAPAHLQSIAALCLDVADGQKMHL